MFRMSELAALLSLLLIIILAPGCASPTRGEQMIQGFARTRQALGSAQGKVDTTVQAINSLRMPQGENLSNAFRSYREAVTQLEEEGTITRRRATVMKEDAEGHIKAWQREMEDIKDPTMKASLESRRQAVRTNFVLIRMYADDARKFYEPFLKGNKDLIQALSIDLSPAAVASLSPSIDAILANGRSLQERISMMQRAMDNIANGISPLGQ